MPIRARPRRIFWGNQDPTYPGRPLHGFLQIFRNNIPVPRDEVGELLRADAGGEFRADITICLVHPNP
eukprot:142243-Pyramimonas_sp.AAC.1